MEQQMGMVTGELRSFWKSRVQGIRALALALAALALAACGGGDGGSGSNPAPAPPQVTLYIPRVTMQSMIVPTNAEASALHFGLSNSSTEQRALTGLSLAVDGAAMLPGSVGRLMYRDDEIARATESGGTLTFFGFAVWFSSGFDVEFEVLLSLPPTVAWQSDEHKRSITLTASSEDIQIAQANTIITGSPITGGSLYRERGTVVFPRNEELFSGDLETGEITLLTKTPTISERDAIFSADGTFIVFAANSSALRKVNTDGTGYTLVPMMNGCVNPDGGLTLDPTNTVVIYGGLCDRGPGNDDERDILASKLDGTGATNFTEDAFFDYSPTTSNGRDVFYISCETDGEEYPTNRSVSCAVYRIEVDLETGSRVGERQLVYGGFQMMLSFIYKDRLLTMSPDGQQLLVGPVMSGGGIVLDLQGNVLRRIQTLNMLSPSWDSAGRIFYFDSRAFRVVNADGTDDRLLPEIFWEDCGDVFGRTTCGGGIGVFIPQVGGY